MNKLHLTGLTFLLLIIPRILFPQDLNDTALIRHSLNLAGSFRNHHPDSMLFYSENARDLSIRIRSEKHLSQAYQMLADYYKMNEDYGKATENLLNALKIEERQKNTVQIARLYDELGDIYCVMEKFQRSMNYYNRSLEIYRKKSDSISIARLLYHIGKLHGLREYCENRTVAQKREDYYTAISFFRESQGIYERHKSNAGLSAVYLNYASVYNRLEKPDKALPFVLQAMQHYKKENDADGIATSLYTLAITYRRLKQYDRSIASFRETIDFGTKNHITEGLQFVYEALGQAYEEAGDYKNSLRSYKKYMILRDSIYNNEKSRQIFELETKYQSEKKERQILALTLEKKRKQLYVYLLLSVLVILSLGGVYIVYRTRSRAVIAEQKSLINEQKLKEMEKERQLIAVHAVLHGEESERSRLARDLHDGLGGLLSGLKLSLNSMKGNILLSEKNVGQFNHAVDLLDTSMKELRRVAHNMMPEALTKFGLREALTDFCAGLDNSGPEIQFRFYGKEKRLDHNYEINLYRIAQELINNAIKHANASLIIIMVVQEEDRIHLTVQDNGTGFNPSDVDGEGMGIANIRSRTESLNGKLEIFSEPEKGTEINVEFNNLN